MRIEQSYDNTFSVGTLTNTTDSGGAIIPGSTSKSTGNKGKLDMLSGDKVLLNEKKDVIANYMLFCNEISIDEKDIVISDSVTYDVTRVDKTLLRGQNPHYEVYLLKQDE